VIDPEDLQAHYNLMLCWQGLGDARRAAAEQALYERFKADESSQFITGPYRQLHPEDNNERQQIHEHESSARAGVNPALAHQAGGRYSAGNPAPPRPPASYLPRRRSAGGGGGSR
ncbi:MAG: hypothetical protein DMF81_05140, partial [Acidobacteria bacterium]